MALVLADRVKETTTTTGTGALSLASSATGFQSFADGVGDGNTTYYAVSSALGDEYEVGIGTYDETADELSRDTVLASSNGGSLVDFSSGTKDVYVVYPADKSVYKDESDVVPATTFASLTGDLTGDVTGNADTASALETARTIALSGDVTGSTSFDGSGNVTISTTLDGGNADTLDGEQGTYYLNYNNFTNTPTLYTSSDFDTDFSSKSTSDLSEGTNLYYTDARARDSVSASGDLSYDSDTGVFSFTERTDSEVRGLFSASGDLAYSSTTGEFSVTTYKSSDFDSDFSGKDTDDLSEGTSNLYYTDARARDSVSASGDISYDSTTGVFSYSERSDSDIRSLFSAAGDLSYDSATGEFSVTVPAGYDSSDFDSDFSGKDTDDLSEGTSNLYYTDARVDARIGDGTLTVSGGSGLTGSGTFDANQSTNSSVTLSHADTSSVSDLTASDRVYVTGITFDTYGHVTGYETQDEGAVDVSTVPFFTTDGVRSDISLVSGTEIPFFLADGSQNNIPLAA